MEPDSSQLQYKRQHTLIEIQETTSKRKKNFFHCESGQTLEQVAQSDCVVSTFGNIQNVAGHSSGQMALADLAGVGLDDPQRSLPTSTIL